MGAGEMTKTEREELRRLMRARFKLLRTDVKARQAELVVEMNNQIEAAFAEREKALEDARYKIKLAVDTANRQANDIARELYGTEEWGTKIDRAIVTGAELPNLHANERRKAFYEGTNAIEARVRNALLELDRQETELLTELATSALESAESKAFFSRIPSVSELVPAYRLGEITS